jgi:hypothetical protein
MRRNIEALAPGGGFVFNTIPPVLAAGQCSAGVTIQPIPRIVIRGEQGVHNLRSGWMTIQPIPRIVIRGEQKVLLDDDLQI